MNKTILSPDDFFEKISSSVKNFQMTGTSSMDNDWHRQKKDIYYMSWRIKFESKTQDRRWELFLPKTLARLMQRDECMPGANPIDAALRDYEAPWLAEDSSLLALCTENERDTVTIQLVDKGFRYVVTQSFGSKGLHSFRKETWQEVLDTCILNALMADRVHFYQFDYATPFNQSRILNVLRDHPIQSDDAAQMMKVDLTNHLEGMGGQHKARKM